MAYLRWLLFTILTLGGTAWALLWLAPASWSSTRLSTVFGVAHALAFPRISAASVLALVLVVVLIRLLRSGARKAKPDATGIDSGKGHKAGLAFFLLPTLLWGGPAIDTLIDPVRGLRPSSVHAVACSDSRSYTVTTWNALGHVTAGNLTTLLADDPDVLVLPEANPATSPALALAGYQLFVSALPGPGSGVDPVTVLVHQRLGEYRVATQLPVTFGAITLEAIDGQGPRFTGVHTAPPLPGLMADWRADLAQVRGLIEDGNSVIAGDLNATLHHGGLAQGMGRTATVGDAGLATDTLEGSWPAEFPGWASSPIDHILLPHLGAQSIDTSRTFWVEGSDHRAVTSKLTLCTGGAASDGGQAPTLHSTGTEKMPETGAGTLAGRKRVG